MARRNRRTRSRTETVTTPSAKAGNAADPRQVDAQFAAAANALERGDQATARTRCIEVLEIAPRHPGAHFILGIIQLNANQLEGAVGSFREAARLAPNQAQHWSALGVAEQQTGELERAVSSYQRALELAPQDAITLFNLGTAHKQAHQLEAANTAYRQSYELNATDPNTVRAYARSSLELANIELAADLFEQLYSLRPDDPDVHDQLLFCSLKAMRPERALEIARATQSKWSGQLSGLIGESCALMATGEPLASIPVSEAVQRRMPGERYTLANLALAAAETGDEPAESNLHAFDRLPWAQPVSPPQGYDNIGAFNQAIREHIESHPTLSFDLNAISCHNGSTSDEIFVEPLGPLEFLRAEIMSRAAEFLSVANFPPEHPFVRSKPASSWLSGWVTILNTGGHQGSHIHPGAWLSGVYYVSLPPSMDDDDRNAERAGWIEFGARPSHYPQRCESRTKFLRPQEGLLILFPSYVYHRTVPFDDGNPRISIAFDIRPLEDNITHRQNALPAGI